jgi:hypothetical protein
LKRLAAARAARVQGARRHWWQQQYNQPAAQQLLVLLRALLDSVHAVQADADGGVSCGSLLSGFLSSSAASQAADCCPSWFHSSVFGQGQLQSAHVFDSCPGTFWSDFDLGREEDLCVSLQDGVASVIGFMLSCCWYV